MNQQILFVSRDEHVILARFCCGGISHNVAEGLGRAVSLALSLEPDLVILEQSYSEHERTVFIECLLESYPDIRVLYLQYGEVIRLCFSKHARISSRDNMVAEAFIRFRNMLPNLPDSVV